MGSESLLSMLLRKNSSKGLSRQGSEIFTVNSVDSNCGLFGLNATSSVSSEGHYETQDQQTANHYCMEW